MERYIEYFNGYRLAYGVADFEHPDAYIDQENGKKKLFDRLTTEQFFERHKESKSKVS